VNDMAFVAGSVLFFALMLAYVRGCEHLGRSSTVETAKDETSRQ